MTLLHANDFVACKWLCCMQVTLLHANDLVACKWLCCMLHLALHVDNQVLHLDTQVTLSSVTPRYASHLVKCYTSIRKSPCQVLQLDTQVTLSSVTPRYASHLVTCKWLGNMFHYKNSWLWPCTMFRWVSSMTSHAWRHTLQSTELYVESSLVTVLGAELSSHVHYSPAM